MIIVETSIFTRQITKLLSDEDYRLLQLDVADTPDLGAVIPGTGGLRKLRWRVPGMGKRGGARLIYYWASARQMILMLLVYSKAEQEDLTPEQLKTLSRLVHEELT